MRLLLLQRQSCERVVATTMVTAKAAAMMVTTVQTSTMRAVRVQLRCLLCVGGHHYWSCCIGLVCAEAQAATALHSLCCLLLLPMALQMMVAAVTQSRQVTAWRGAGGSAVAVVAPGADAAVAGRSWLSVARGAAPSCVKVNCGAARMVCCRGCGVFAAALPPRYFFVSVLSRHKKCDWSTDGDW